MSLILDALKKSEAERQLGRAPGLTTPMPLRRGETDEPVRSWLRYAVWLAIAGLAVAAVWWLARDTPTESAAAEEFQREASPAATKAAGPHEDPTSPAPVVAATPANSSSAAEDETIDAKRGAPSPRTVPSATASKSPPRVVEASAPKLHAPDSDSVERETEAIVAPAPEPPAGTISPPPSAVEPAVSPAPAPSDAATVTEAVESPLEALPRLDQLGGPQRDALPPLKQTMHVYAEMPAARFVLIDGHRYREGDQLSATLQLLEIRRDGTVLQFDGLRFLLPRP